MVRFSRCDCIAFSFLVVSVYLTLQNKTFVALLAVERPYRGQKTMVVFIIVSQIYFEIVSPYGNSFISEHLILTSTHFIVMFIVS